MRSSARSQVAASPYYPPGIPERKDPFLDFSGAASGDASPPPSVCRGPPPPAKSPARAPPGPRPPSRQARPAPAQAAFMNKWVLALILAGFALFMYAAIIYKMS
jgi:hypothetical protein